MLGSETKISYSANWSEYGAHVVTPKRERSPLSARSVVGLERDRLRRHRLLRAAFRLARRRAHLDAALVASIHDPAYLRANLRGGEFYDFFYADAAARRAQARTPITDHRGKAVDLPRQRPLELVGLATS